MSNRIYEPAPVESVRVNIFNQIYTLRSPSGSEYIRRIARLVDERMHEISAQLTTHDAAKVAVLAALNIADELQTVREKYEREREAWLLAATPPPPPLTETNKELAELAAEEAAQQKASEQQTWFDAIFDDEAPARLSRERLTSQISAKLQSLRQANETHLEAERENGRPSSREENG